MEKQKEIAISFLRLASSGKVREAYEKYIHQDFRHHNPYFKGDRESLLKGMEESAGQFPYKRFEAIRALADGNLVAVHGKVQLNPDLLFYHSSDSFALGARMNHGRLTGQ